MNAYEVNGRYGLLQVKLCDPCLSALQWFVYHTKRYTSARIYIFHLPYLTHPLANMHCISLNIVTWLVYDCDLRQS